MNFDPDNSPGRIDDVKDLVDSVGALKQQIPGIVYPHPGMPGKYIAADGNRRLMACRILGIPFQAIVLDHQPSKKELRRIRVAANNAHKHMSPDQIADEIREHIAETGDTQEQAAEFFGISPSYVSKILAPSKWLLPELSTLADNPKISKAVIRIVATMPTPEKQKQLAEHVLAHIKQHGKAKRDNIQRIANEIKGKKAKKSRPATATKDGASLILPSDWRWERVVRWMAEQLKKFEREAKLEAEGKETRPITDLQKLL
ncbi:hypothetical protein FRUB_06031 [Fimbriiglobus ruber]|uniref:ParB-like N-terminal domain-containing protein n=1 Tax=Fimbriiglobus ruber TaxID=1908690 RepID=A0A225DLP1_9BACT|nr:hypothetical protein FRUB_06031 [Fimbriiglobus ruber]